MVSDLITAVVFSCLNKASDEHIMYNLLDCDVFDSKGITFKEISLMPSPAGFYFNNLIKCVWPITQWKKITLTV